jgi:general secretion pathway protein D
MVRRSSVLGTTGSVSLGSRGVPSTSISFFVALLVSGACMLAGCDKNNEPSDSSNGGGTQTWVQQDQPMEQLAAPPSTQPIEWPEPQIILTEEEPVEQAESGDPATTQPATTQPVVSSPVLEPARRVATLIYPTRHVRSELLAEAVEGLISPEGSIQSSPSLNSIVISDDHANVKAVLKVLTALDRPMAQLLVEARIIEVRVDNDLEFEIRHTLNIGGANEPGGFFQPSSVNLQTPGAEVVPNQGASFVIRPWFRQGEYLENAIRALLKRGKARILSSPNLLVSPGTEASIITGEEVPVLSTQVVGSSLSTNTQFKRVGIKLRVNLLQMTSDSARIEVNPEVSTVTRFTEATDQVPSNPIIALRNVSSTLTMKNGEVLTVGGLLTDSERLSLRGIPLLMDIPGIGLLFQSRRHQVEKTQLIFFLRVHILNEGSTFTTRLHKPGSATDVIEERSGIVLPDVPRREYSPILEGPKPADASPPQPAVERQAEEKP